MSHDVVAPAYRTKIGNLTAKSVLVLMADNANADGFGWPSIPFIVDRTEICKRTVLRVIQVFLEIGLVEKSYNPEKDRRGFQINMAMLGTDLTERFKTAYAKAQGEEKCLTDTPESVSQTQTTPAETQPEPSQTQKSVSQTQPPHPLKGRTVNEPSVNQPPDTVDTRILCEELGIFRIREQEEVNRMYVSFCATNNLDPITGRKRIKRRWGEYQKAMPNLEWTFSSPYNFLMSGIWNSTEAWPKKKNLKSNPMDNPNFFD